MRAIFGGRRERRADFGERAKRVASWRVHRSLSAWRSNKRRRRREKPIFGARL